MCLLLQFYFSFFFLGVKDISDQEKIIVSTIYMLRNTNLHKVSKPKQQMNFQEKYIMEMKQLVPKKCENRTALGSSITENVLSAFQELLCYLLHSQTKYKNQVKPLLNPFLSLTDNTPTSKEIKMVNQSGIQSSKVDPGEQKSWIFFFFQRIGNEDGRRRPRIKVVSRVSLRHGPVVTR